MNDCEWCGKPIHVVHPNEKMQFAFCSLECEEKFEKKQKRQNDLIDQRLSDSELLKDSDIRIINDINYINTNPNEFH